MACSLGTCDLKLVYRSGKANADADGLSRKPQMIAELFPDAVKAICHAYTVKRDSCPYIETYIVSNDSHTTESQNSQAQQQFPSTELLNIDWSKQQLADANLARIIESFDNGFCPEKCDLRDELPVVLKYIREWIKLVLIDGVLMAMLHSLIARRGSGLRPNDGLFVKL